MNDLAPPAPEQLRDIIKKHGITRNDAAALVHVSVNVWHKWTACAGSKDYRQMPLAAWELLLLKLNEHPEKKLVD